VIISYACGVQSHGNEPERGAKCARLFKTNIKTQTLLSMDQTRSEGSEMKMKRADGIVDAKTRDALAEATATS